MSLTAESSLPLQKEGINHKPKRALDMPYVSDKQRRFFNANKSRMEAQGVDVDEYNQASKGMKLPERAPSQAKPKRRTFGQRLADRGRG